jgi:hypothetical protein
VHEIGHCCLRHPRPPESLFLRCVRRRRRPPANIL